MDGLEAIELNIKELENNFTIGSEYYSKLFVDSNLILERSNIKRKSLAEVSELITDGDHGSPDYQDEGVLYLLSESIKDGFIDTSIHRYITPQQHKALKRSRLKPGDVVITKTGVYFGKSAVIPDSIEEANTSAHVGKISLKDGVNPYYLSTFLNCKYGHLQMRRRGIKATRPEIKLIEFDDISVPIPLIVLQENVERVVRQGQQILLQAERLYSDIEEILLSELGIDNFRAPTEGIAVKSLSESFGSSGRLDAEHYQLKYDIYDECLKNNPNGCVAVSSVFEQVKTSFDKSKDSYNYIEISDINVGSGVAEYNLIDVENLPANAKIRIAKGDLLISKVRPYRGAVSIVDLDVDDLIVSGAFTVLREKGKYPKETLSVLFRTSIYKDWFLKWNVGSSYPVIKDEDVLNMLIPLFQNDIHILVAQKVQESFKLRNQSKLLLGKAKRAVEIAIEQSEAEAITFLSE